MNTRSISLVTVSLVIACSSQGATGGGGATSAASAGSAGSTSSSSTGTGSTTSGSSASSSTGAGGASTSTSSSSGPGGAGTGPSDGGDGTPGQVTNVTVFASGSPGHLYATGQLPTRGSSAIAKFNGILSPSGITGTASVLTNPVTGPSVRVDFYGVGSTAQTARLQAVNASGAGPFSPASANSATAAQFTDTFQGQSATYVGYGGSAVGMSSLWHNGYFDFANLRDVTPGTPTNAGAFVPTANAPAYPTGFGVTNQKMLEVTPQGASGYAVLMNILQDNPAAGNNGAFGIVPYKYFFFLVYKVGATSGNFLSQPEFTANYEGVITGVSGATVTDRNQNWPADAFNPTISALFNHNTGSGIGYTSNTANTFQAASGSWNVGDHYDLQVGDQPYGTQISDYATYITAPTPGALTANAWNVVEVPISAMGISGLNNDLFYKVGIGAPTPSTKDVFWLSCVGWSQ